MSDDISLQDVSVAFSTPNGPRHVLKNLTCAFEEGSWTAVVGANGSGKSTMGRVLAGLCEVSKGTVHRPHRSTNSDGRPSTNIQMVFQNPEAQIIGQTLYEDVCFGLENIAFPTGDMLSCATDSLRQVGLTYPITHPTEDLSGGQKQLLSIASCLAVHPDVIVFDEATSMLNPAGRQLVLDKVKQLHRTGLTVIWITQWLEELSYADQVVALIDGELAYQGDVRAFFYGAHSGTSTCDDLGFVAPYTVQVARELQKNGVSLPSRPITPSELEAALEAICQFT